MEEKASKAFLRKDTIASHGLAFNSSKHLGNKILAHLNTIYAKDEENREPVGEI
jgi:hypothetical protein